MHGPARQKRSRSGGGPRRTVEPIKQVAGNTTGTELSVCCPGPSDIAIERGAIITQFSPAGGTYSAQNRLRDFDNGDPGCPPFP